MATVRQLITDTFKLIGARAAGEVPRDDEMTDGFNRLNNMISSWTLQKLTIHSITRTEYDLVSGQGTYEIGPTAADFVQARPVWINRVGIIQNNNPSQPIELPMEIQTTKDWATEIPVKNTFSALSTKVYIDGAFPNRNMTFWPIPNVGNLDIAIYWPQAITQFTTVDDTVAWPDGYEEAVRYNLAIRLAPEFGREINQVIVAVARDTLSWIKTANAEVQQLEMRVDDAITAPGRVFDWRTGDPL